MGGNALGSRSQALNLQSFNSEGATRFVDPDNPDIRLSVIPEEGSPDTVKVTKSNLPPEMRNKGLGKQLYRQVGETLAGQGKQMISDTPFDMDVDATRVWESLVKSGDAEKLGNGRFRFISRR